jgi:hypothetical protein
MQVVLKNILAGSELSTANLKLKENEPTVFAAISKESSRVIKSPRGVKVSRSVYYLATKYEKKSQNNRLHPQCT